ncbi:hypothetical protein AL523_18085 [Enterococcus gallinarum]|nr:hypothetical protein AL523_18085 [Enterococcus gallinarum]EPH93093.1 hypothetical protein D922_02158 [Enterococcus faecalis 06-MB-DW-09]
MESARTKKPLFVLILLRGQRFVSVKEKHSYYDRSKSVCDQLKKCNRRYSGLVTLTKATD